MPSHENTADLVRDFISTDLLNGQVNIDDQTSLFQARLIDSMNLVHLLAFLESTFAIKIPTSEVNVGNLDTVESIERLVRKVRS